MATVPGKKKDLSPIDRKPDNPRRLYMSKEEAKEDSKKWRLAMIAREEAFKKEMNKLSLDVKPEIAKAEANVLRDKQLVKSCNDAVNRIEEELKDAEGSEKTQLKKDLKKANTKVEEAIQTLAKTEEVLEELKK